MTENLIPQIIQQAKNKRISFEKLTPLEQQAVDEFAKEIQQKSNVEFLTEDIIYCINKSKGCPTCCAQLINDRLKTFRDHGGRREWLLFKELLNGTYDE